MSSTRLTIVIAGISLLIIPGSLRVGSSPADEPVRTTMAATTESTVEPALDDELSPPPGDPWYEPAQDPQQRGGRTNTGDRLVFKARIEPHWFDHNNRFWYRNQLADGASEFIVVEAEHGTRQPAFDQGRIAASLSKASGKAYTADRLPFDKIDFVSDSAAVQFKVADQTWKCDLGSYECSRNSIEPPSPLTMPPDQEPRRRADQPSTGDSGSEIQSPDKKWTAFVKKHNVFVREQGKTDETQLSSDGLDGLSYVRLMWYPDSRTLLAYRMEPGDRKEVYLIQSSPAGGGRAKMSHRPYPLPGDKFSAYELNLFDVAAKKQIKPKVDRVDFGTPRPQFHRDGRHFTYEKVDRGHQRFRLIEIDVQTGDDRTIIDEKSDTFIWTAHTEAIGARHVNWLDETNEIVYVSERDGWRHLYLIDAKTGAVKNPITRGEYVVRGIDRIDEANRQVWFRASGKVVGQDPYFMHYFRVNFDGTGLVALTGGDGNHSVQYSPDRRYLIDTYSRVDLAPVHALRRVADGGLVCLLERADISLLRASGWQPPEVFVAKGRDGKTDIWGIICRPSRFDPARKYPVIEQIYAGPQGAFVPKTFSAAKRFSALTDLGFIVVQMDGMGTAHRSKAFHDVCWHNLKDAGFPDRIAWHRAAAKQYPSYDLSRVGIYGTSAGGQNATGGVLFHGDFYKVAASACGCHDNRMDKASWNEQWMGDPVGPWYSASSNIDNAAALRGKLLLIVGEMDTNVPPESTMRLVDALIKAGKDFDLLVVPNANHGNGGAYGQRKMNDFFVRHLMNGSDSPANGPARDNSVARVALASTASEGQAPVRPAQPAPSVAAVDATDMSGDPSELRGAIERFSADRGITLRSAPPSVSPAHDARQRAFTQSWLDRLGKLDFDSLSQDGKVDYLLFANYLAHELRQIDQRGEERAEVTPFIPFAETILGLEEARRGLKTSDWSKTATTLDKLAKQIVDTQRDFALNVRSERRPSARSPTTRSRPSMICATRCAYGSTSTTATTHCSRGGPRNRTRQPIRDFRSTRPLSASALGPSRGRAAKVGAAAAGAAGAADLRAVQVLAAAAEVVAVEWGAAERVEAPAAQHRARCATATRKSSATRSAARPCSPSSSMK